MRKGNLLVRRRPDFKTDRISLVISFQGFRLTILFDFTKVGDFTSQKLCHDDLLTHIIYLTTTKIKPFGKILCLFIGKNREFVFPNL